MDATEGMKKAIEQRKKLTDEKIKLMRTARIASEPYRQRRREEQRRQ
ncbi:hypothetical protein ES703_54173 [subsurface metagenome]